MDVGGELKSPGRRQRILVLRGWPFFVGLPQALSPSTMQRPHLLVHTCKEAGSFITHLSRSLLPRETHACQACSLHNFLEKQGSQSFARKTHRELCVNTKMPIRLLFSALWRNMENDLKAQQRVLCGYRNSVVPLR